jgi:hypothetical protein
VAKFFRWRDDEFAGAAASCREAACANSAGYSTPSLLFPHKECVPPGIYSTPASMMWLMVDGTNEKGNGHKPHEDLKPYIVRGPAEPAQLPAAPRPIELTQPAPTPAKHRNRLTDERLTAFLNLYVSNGFHAVKACIALGMTPRTAHAHAHRYVDAIRGRMSLQQTFKESGLDLRLIARKLARLMDATEPKWNCATQSWDRFENCAAQLEAIKQTARLLNLYPFASPPEEPLTVNVIIDVPL